jgi:biotin transport system substrate-specific component
VNGIVRAWPAYGELRYRAFTWRHELPAAKKIALAFGMAAVTGVLAQVRFPLPFTPVPVTGQTLGVLLAGVLLGRYYGGLSQVIYVGLGTAGLPWFAGFTRGLGALTGVTGGYLVGFILAAELIAHFSDRYVAARRFWPQILLMALGAALILECGTAWLSVVMHVGIDEAAWLGLLPFLPGDALKVLLAASLSTALLPKASYNGEIDAAAHPHRP